MMRVVFISCGLLFAVSSYRVLADCLRTSGSGMFEISFLYGVHGVIFSIVSVASFWAAALHKPVSPAPLPPDAKSQQ